jgi:2-C-methyl-D-erythritol 4-phosphate cytidylyltransferase
MELTPTETEAQGIRQDRLASSGAWSSKTDGRAEDHRAFSGNGEPVPKPAGWSRSIQEPTVAVVVLAAGSSGRVGASLNKVYLPLAGRPVVAWSMATLARLPRLHRMVLVVRPEDRATAAAIVEWQHCPVPIELVDGGPTRHASEENGLRHLATDIRDGVIDVVLIHDGARPLGSWRLAMSVLRAAATYGGAVPGLPAEDVVEVADDGHYLGSGHVRVSTPQGFAARALLKAYEAAAVEGFTGTDTSSCVERYTSLTVRYIRGEDSNIKITYPQDLWLAEQLLLQGQSPTSSGDA